VTRASRLVRGEFSSTETYAARAIAEHIYRRCRNFGVKHDGYASAIDKRTTLHSLVPKLAPNFQPILWEPSNAFFKSEKDYRYFRSFCEKTALQLDGFVPTDLRSRLVLQECERSQSVRHGIVAIAALDLTSDASHNRIQASHYKPDGSDPDAHHQFALQQYGLAVRHMRNAIFKADQDLSTLLMTCLVIICFEAFRGNHNSAFSQLAIGLRMIEQAANTDTSRRDHDTVLSSASTPNLSTLKTQKRPSERSLSWST
jgi:hypothetical protein